MKRGEKAPSTGSMLQYISNKHPRVYETIMKTSSHSATTKEDRALDLAGESNKTPEVELTPMPATSGS